MQMKYPIIQSGGGCQRRNKTNKQTKFHSMKPKPLSCIMGRALMRTFNAINDHLRPD